MTFFLTPVLSFCEFAGVKFYCFLCGSGVGFWVKFANMPIF